MLPAIDEILENFDLLTDWDDRYRYVIELGRMLPDLAQDEQIKANLVPGCVSQVWLVKSVEMTGKGPLLYYRGDSDALIVRGIVAIILAIFSGKSAREIYEIEAEAILAQIGLNEHLTPQRANGLRSMMQRIKQDAVTALAAA